MKRRSRFIIALIILILGCGSSVAQRKVTPVDPNPPAKVKRPVIPGKPKPLDRTNVEERRDANGNIILVDTVTGLEVVDSLALVQNKPRNLYPRFTSLTFGVNVWDPLMRCFGQQYGIGDVWARLSLYNRFMPYAAFGFGNANISPDGLDYTWKSKVAPYLKLGLDYNVFYNNTPDYQLFVGAHYGITHFCFQVDNVTVPPGYWDDGGVMSIPSQASTVGFFELALGIRVKLFGPVAAGWSFNFRSVLHESKCLFGDPMYIPGFGKRGQSIGGTLSIIYTIPLNRHRLTKVDKTDTSATFSTDTSLNSTSGQ